MLGSYEVHANNLTLNLQLILRHISFLPALQTVTLLQFNNAAHNLVAQHVEHALLVLLVQLVLERLEVP